MMFVPETTIATELATPRLNAMNETEWAADLVLRAMAFVASVSSYFFTLS